MSEKNSPTAAIVLASAMAGGAIAGIANPSLLAYGALGGTAVGSVTAVATNTRRYKVVEGRTVVYANQFNLSLGAQKCLKMAGITLTRTQESLSIITMGRSGAGKSQEISELLYYLRQHPDFRVIVLDAGGEYLRSFYDSNSDLIFNPEDERSVGWTHLNERSSKNAPKSLSSQRLAEALIPTPAGTPDTFWYEAARSVLVEIFRTPRTNGEVRQLLISPPSVLRELLVGTSVSHYFEDARTAASVLSVLATACRFYESLSDGDSNQISFYNYGKSNAGSWLFIPIHNQDEVLKPLFSMAIELMILGVLSRDPEGQNLKTIFVIDELAGLQKLSSLSRLLEQGRKCGGSACLGVQSISSIKEIYGENVTDSIIQNTYTKFVVCNPEPKNAKYISEMIGNQRIEEEQTSKTSRVWSLGDESITRTKQQSERDTIPARTIQSLPTFDGYMVTSDIAPIVKFTIKPRNYGSKNPAFIANPNRFDSWQRDVGL